ncbi:Haloacid dehalogenase-like hydrolase [Macrophomina phaseolina MS6]|uniref:Haloacid dehalogenase-like hydrolase n=1 Tax=Macrophomina phaseolina (strain MS6) TaxID=1126212 RepID=K2SAA9_MACPH|nr:Haloacid dehalogenase-like hydrolase [Macrophomina phaseolina MS6]
MPAFSAVVAFADSFTDSGNGSARITNGTWPHLPQYFSGGRFSDGPVWVEYVAGNLSVPLYNYAVGGATTSNKLAQGFSPPNFIVPVPSIDEQVEDFLSAPPAGLNISSTAAVPLFFLWSGANDAIFYNITASQVSTSLASTVYRLRERYPTSQIVLLNYPSLDKLPASFYASRATKTTLHTFSTTLDALLRDFADGGSDLTTYINLVLLFDDFEYYAEPDEYGFVPLGSYGSCLVNAFGEAGPDVPIEVCEEGFGVRVWMDAYQ